MSASVVLVGLDMQRMREAFEKSVYWDELDRKDVKNRLLEGSTNTEDLIYLFYLLSARLDDAGMKRFGMEVFYSQGIKRYCFDLAQALQYYLLGFTWQGEITVEHYGSDYKLSHEQVMGVFEWFDVLSAVFGSGITGSMRADYLKAANALKEYQGADDSYFLYTEDIFGDVLNHLATAHQHSFLWMYSF